jgi:glycosyltransferase involved in cell wall biosynthesis
MTGNEVVWVVVPAYNEETVLLTVLTDLLSVCPQVVVVDDGSTDDTASVAVSAGATVVRHPINLGQGAALQTGIDYALSRQADYIVTFDADGQHDPGDIAALLDTVRRPDVDVALGSRFLGHASGMSRGRRLLLKAAALFTVLTTGMRLTDAHNGFRAISAEAARKIYFTQNGMAHASELLNQIKARGMRWMEVPVHIRYTPYSKGKGQTTLDGINIVLDLLAGRLGR